VTSGQFLIDSEASLKATTTRLADVGAALHRAQGKVEAIDDKAVTLSHGAIPSAKMGAMTMEFQLARRAPGVAPGTDVDFDLQVTPKGEYVVTELRPRAAKAHGNHK